jgi:hypothetical protein
MNTLVPDNFKIPEGFLTEHFKARMLTINDVVKDYEAVMTSVDHLQGVFGANSSWPSKDLTLEQDLIDLGWHQKEFQKKTSFAYTVMSPDEETCLGCFYIYPSDDSNYDAVVYMWVRKSAYDESLDPILEKTVKNWIKEKWLFNKVLYFGRT